MSRGTHITRAFVVVAVLLIGLYDLVALAAWGVDATISRVLVGGGSVVPAIPFCIGFVMGHLFWPQPKPTGQPAVGDKPTSKE